MHFKNIEWKMCVSCSAAANELPAIQWADSAGRLDAEDRGGKASLQRKHAVAAICPTRYDVRLSMGETCFGVQSKHLTCRLKMRVQSVLLNSILGQWHEGRVVLGTRGNVRLA